MYYVLAIFIIFSIISAIINFKSKKFILSIFQVVLPIITATYIYFFCKLKAKFVFGGTDFDFLIQTAFTDGLIEPWIILIVYIIQIYFIVSSFINLFKNKE